MTNDFSTFACPPAALEIIRTLQAAGHQAVLAGGCVRDFLLGRPSQDYDIATSAHPEQVEQLFPKTYAIGKAFGIIAVLADEQVYEVATFRCESDYQDGRHPKTIAFASLEEDVQRRDFSINAMLFDPISGTLHDYVGGQQDLQQRIIRTVGDAKQRFQEDKLRLLRAVRFAVELGFSIEAETWTAMVAESPNITCVSQERIAAELNRIMLSPAPDRGLKLLDSCGMLRCILPEVCDLQGVPQPPEYHPEGDVWEHTLIMLAGFASQTGKISFATTGPRFHDGRLARASQAEWLALAWAVLLHDLGKPGTFSQSDRIRFYNHDQVGAEMAVTVLRRLRQSSELCETVRELVRRHMTLANFPKMRLATQRRLLQDPLFPLHLELHYLDCWSSHGLLDVHRALLQAWEKEENRPVPPQPLLTGADLIALGYRPGPLFRTILDTVQDANLEGVLQSKADALEWVKEHYQPA